MPGAASEFLLQRAKDLALSVKGVAFHIGVGCLQYEIFAKAIEDSAAAFAFGKSLGLKMDLLDVGGGFPGRETDTIVSEQSRYIERGAKLLTLEFCSRLAWLK